MAAAQHEDEIFHLEMSPLHPSSSSYRRRKRKLPTSFMKICGLTPIEEYDSEEEEEAEEDVVCDVCDTIIFLEEDYILHSRVSKDSPSDSVYYCNRCATYCSDCQESIIFLNDGVPENKHCQCIRCNASVCTDCIHVHEIECKKMYTMDSPRASTPPIDITRSE